MLGPLNHVAIAVPDIHAAAETYKQKFNAKVSEAVPQPDHGVTTVFVDLGNTKIELLEPLGENSPIAGFLAKNPKGGIHHICIEVEDIDAAVAADEFAASIPLIDNSISEKDGLGVFEPELLAQTWKWVAEAQELPEDTLDPQDVVTNDYLPE